MPKRRYKVEKSQFPEDNKTHLVVMYSNTRYGVNYQRVFKGTYQECLEKKKELEEANEPERTNARLFAKKQNNNNTRKCNATRNN